MITVGIDLDGVLADFISKMRPLLGFGDVEVPRTWNWSDLGTTREDISDAWATIKCTSNWFRDLPPLPGVEDLMASLIRGEFLDRWLVFITSRPQTRGDTISEQCSMWLEEHLGLRHPSVMICKSPAQKLDALRTYNVDYMLDDYAPMVALAQSLRCKTFLLRQPWNQADEDAYSLPAVWSVREFLGIIKGDEEK